MNIQDKINQLKTPHKFDITYHVSDEIDNHVITCICFEVYTGEEMEASGELEEMRHRAKVLKDNQLNLSDYEVFLSDFEKVLDAAS